MAPHAHKWLPVNGAHKVTNHWYSHHKRMIEIHLFLYTVMIVQPNISEKISSGDFCCCWSLSCWFNPPNYYLFCVCLSCSMIRLIYAFLWLKSRNNTNAVGENIITSKITSRFHFDENIKTSEVAGFADRVLMCWITKGWWKTTCVKFSATLLIQFKMGLLAQTRFEMKTFHKQ